MSEHRLSTIAIAAMMVLPIFAMLTPAGALESGINDDMQKHVDASLGPEFAKGEWQTKREWTTFYMHTTQSTGGLDEATGGDGGTAYKDAGTETSNGQHLWLDTQRPLDYDADDDFKRLLVWDEPALDGGFAATFNWLGWHKDFKDHGCCGPLGDMTNMSVHAVEATIYAELRDAPLDAHYFYFDFWIVNATTGARVQQLANDVRMDPTANGQAGDVVPFTGSRSLDLDDGILIGSDRTVSIDVFYGPDTILTGLGDNTWEFLLDVDNYPSNVKLLTDSARLNWWTEDRLGNVVDTFPTGQLEQTEDTRLRFKLLYANLWGNQDEGDYTSRAMSQSGLLTATGAGEDWCNGGWTDGGTDNPWNCPYDALDQREFEIQFRNVATQNLMPVDLGRGLVGGDPLQDETLAQCCNNDDHYVDDFRLIDYTNILVHEAPVVSDPMWGVESIALFEWELAYNATFPDGSYKIEFRDDNRNALDWEDYKLVHIGGVGFEIVPAVEEERFLTYEIDPDTEELVMPLQFVEVNHTVAVGERTDYHLELWNRGQKVDSFGLSIPVPGNGWKASVNPSQVTIPAGQKADVIVTIESPDTGAGGATSGCKGQVGAWCAISVVASSLRGDDIETIRINTTLTSVRCPTDPPQRDVQGIPCSQGPKLYSTENFVQANPGVLKRIPFSVQNLGTFEDQYIISSDGLPAGWIVDINPSYTSVYSKSVQDFTVAVTPPPEAPRGDTQNLIIRASRVADSSVVDELILPLQMIIRDGMSVDVLHGVDRTWRDINHRFLRCEDDPTGFNARATDCQSKIVENHDAFYDDSALYRFTIRNDGARTDEFKLTGSWMKGIGQDHLGCGEDNANSGSGYRDGVPDGWQFRLLETDGVTSEWPNFPGFAQIGPRQPGAPNPDNGFVRTTSAANAFSGDMRVGSVELAPGESREFYFEMGWRDYPDSDTGCSPLEEEWDQGIGLVLVTEKATWRGFEASPEAGFRLTVRSSNDPTELDVFPLVTDISTSVDQVVMTSANSVDAQSGVMIDPRLHQEPRQIFDPDEERESRFRMRATNLGNQHDNITITVTQQVPGWTHRIVDWTYVNSRITDDGSYNNPRSCAYQTGAAGTEETKLVCRNLGVYDEVYFDVVSTPPPTARIGDRDLVKVSVASGTLQGVETAFSDTILLESIVGGPYAFDLEELNDNVLIEGNTTRAFPFTVHNIGLMPDNYEIKVVEKPDDWVVRLSSEPIVGVPSLLSHHGFLSVTAPPGFSASPEEARFRVSVTCKDCLDQVDATERTKTMDFVARPKAATQSRDPGAFLFMESPAVTLLPDQVQPFTVKVRDDGEESEVWTFYVDPETLPQGYEFVCGPDGQPSGCSRATPDPTFDVRDVSQTGAVREAEATFYVKVPSDQLASSRVAAEVRAHSTAEEFIMYHDVELNLATIYGIDLETVPVAERDGGNVQTTAPGQATTHTFEVRNTGLAPATVRLTSSAVPQGWNMTFTTQETVYVRPGEAVVSEATLQAPLQGLTGQEARIAVFATLIEDTTKQSRLDLVTRIGHYEVNLTATQETRYLGPQESATFQATVQNQGDVRDTIDVTVIVPPEYRDRALVTFTGCSGPDRTVVPRAAGAATSDACRLIGLDPDEVAQIDVNIEIGGEPLAGGSRVPLTLNARSALAPPPDPSICPNNDLTLCQDPNVRAATRTLRMEFLRFTAQDVDDDGLLEFAIDRDRDAANGNEEFRESRSSGVGLDTRVPDLARFLTDEAREDLTVKVTAEDGTTQDVLLFEIDGDDDGRLDHFLDTNADDLPDVYWDPDLRHVEVIEVVRDINQDGLPEYFIDLDGDARLDAYYDLATGTFGGLLQRFVDDDSFIDYIVDVNGNGRGDDQEPILFGGPDGLVLTLLKLDVDGDGRLDDVYDTNGDGVPEYFVPAGSTTEFPIDASKDMNGDGAKDWAYDADQDGRVDSYYDPANGQSSLVDAQSDFVKGLRQFWYIAAIFGLVLVLFIVLVAVTRR